MKLINWETFKYKIRIFFNGSHSKQYLSGLVDNIEKQNSENTNIPFKIADIKQKGFIVKSGGLFCFISFNHMPWKYKNMNLWKIVYPFLKGKIFFGRISKIKKEPIKIVLNADIPQFKKLELFEDENYYGILLSKSNNGLIVDFGYHFNWKCGSLLGFLHRDSFNSNEYFNKIEIGSIIEAINWGSNETGEYIFGNSPELKDWFSGKLETLIGKILPIKVIKLENSKVSFLVENLYIAYLQKTEQTNLAVKNLLNDDIIHCEIVSINKHNRSIILKWESVSEIEGIISRNTKLGKSNYYEQLSINQSHTENLEEKLFLIGKMVNVKVIKYHDKNGREHIKYVVNGKHKGILKISSESYKVTNKQQKQIEKKLNDGQIMEGVALSVLKDHIEVIWKITDQELFTLSN